MRYLTLSELIYINGRIMDDPNIVTGKRKVRDIDLLEAASQRPSASAFGSDAYPTLAEKAAALLHGIARNHPFADGNKRTAVLAAIFMLDVNGLRVRWEEEDALRMILDVAEGRVRWEDLAAWFPLEVCDQSPEEDAERDMRAIERLMGEHRWLLHELAKQ